MTTKEEYEDAKITAARREGFAAAFCALFLMIVAGLSVHELVRTSADLTPGNIAIILCAVLAGVASLSLALVALLRAPKDVAG